MQLFPHVFLLPVKYRTANTNSFNHNVPLCYMNTRKVFKTPPSPLDMNVVIHTLWLRKSGDHITHIEDRWEMINRFNSATSNTEVSVFRATIVNKLPASPYYDTLSVQAPDE